MAELITMPKLGFDMAEGTLIRWVINEGDSINKGDLLAEIETDKATVEIESGFSGVVRKHLVKVDSIVPVNEAIAIIGTADENIDFNALVSFSEPEREVKTETKAEIKSEAAPLPVVSSIPVATNGQYPAGVKVSPLARKMASDLGLNLLSITGSGPGGRIVKKDIDGYRVAPVDAQVITPATTQGMGLPNLSATQIGQVPVDKIIKVTRLRQAIGRRMLQSKLEQPSFYVTNEMDMGPIMKLRKQFNEMLSANGEKLSVNDFIVKATALTLRKFPNLNAVIKDKEVTQFGHVNIGIAVSVENGLLTVVIPDADQKSMRSISQEVKEKATRVRSGKVNPEDISGSTFSISNLGMYNVHNFVAIINPPEAAILAIGSAYQTPVIEAGEVVPGWRMQITVSVDHRVSDGAEAAQFLQALAYYIENPLSLML